MFDVQVIIYQQIQKCYYLSLFYFLAIYYLILIFLFSIAFLQQLLLLILLQPILSFWFIIFKFFINLGYFDLCDIIWLIKKRLILRIVFTVGRWKNTHVLNKFLLSNIFILIYVLFSEFFEFNIWLPFLFSLVYFLKLVNDICTYKIAEILLQSHYAW